MCNLLTEEGELWCDILVSFTQEWVKWFTSRPVLSARVTRDAEGRNTSHLLDAVLRLYSFIDQVDVFEVLGYFL